MGAGGVLDGQAAEQQLVGLGVLVRLADGVGHVVGLGEEATGAQHHHRQAVLAMDQPAQLLGRQLGDPVDVARLDGAVLGQPLGLARAAGRAGPDGLGDHQRGGGGEDEASYALGHGLLQQVQRAGDIDVHESLAVEALDVRLVQGARMDHRLDRVVADDLADQRPVGDRADHRRLGRGHDVEPGHCVASGAQGRPQGPPQPARGSGQQHAHGLVSALCGRLIASPVGATNA